jgi:DNA-binding TFAR19-related protein (PDSD5 family)
MVTTHREQDEMRSSMVTQIMTPEAKDRCKSSHTLLVHMLSEIHNKRTDSI